MQNKILSFLRKNYPQIFFWITMITNVFILILGFKLMSINKTIRDLTPDIIKEQKKSIIKVLTNENDFLVKNLKKPG